MYSFNKKLEKITAEDIVDFCKKKVPEGANLDYKKDFSTKGLAKHFAAFSNSRGGDIIIGIEENKKTGFPEKYEGIDIDKKLEESIHQSALNVSPLPEYSIHITNPLESGTPYYVFNDNNIYIRSHNVTKLVDLASPDYVKVLFEKEKQALSLRSTNEEFLKGSFQKFFSKVEKERLVSLQRGDSVSKDKLGSSSGDLEILIQPYYPKVMDVSMKGLKETAREYDIRGLFQNPKPFPGGLYKETYNLRTLEYRYIVLRGDGSFYWAEDILRLEEDKLYARTGWILTRLFHSMQYLGSIYTELQYCGVITIKVTLRLPDQVLLLDTSSNSFWFPSDPHESILNDYTWEFSFNSNDLENSSQRNKLIVEWMKQIEWDLGFDSSEKDKILMDKVTEHM
jgi:hypothetical protein